MTGDKWSQTDHSVCQNDNVNAGPGIDKRIWIEAASSSASQRRPHYTFMRATLVLTSGLDLFEGTTDKWVSARRVKCKKGQALAAHTNQPWNLLHIISHCRLKLPLLQKKLILSVLQKRSIYLSDIKHIQCLMECFQYCWKTIQNTMLNTCRQNDCTYICMHSSRCPYCGHYMYCMHPPPSGSCRSLNKIHHGQYSAFFSHLAGRVYKRTSVILYWCHNRHNAIIKIQSDWWPSWCDRGRE